jgi:twitching motility protein PilT
MRSADPAATEAEEPQPQRGRHGRPSRAGSGPHAATADSLDGFPLAEDDQTARAAPPARPPPQPPPRARAPTPAAPRPRAQSTGALPARTASGTILPAQIPGGSPAAPARAVPSTVLAATILGPGPALPTASTASSPEPVAPFPPEPLTANNPSVRPLKASEQRPAVALEPKDSYLGRALAVAMRHGASDLHVHSGAPLLIRVDGQLHPLSGNSPLVAEAAEQIIAEITTDAQWTLLSQKGEVDFACEIPGLGRFRANVYREQRGLDAVFRIVPLQPPSLEQLRLPSRLARLTDFRTGMVLCTGPAGCGKSTTLAALLNQLVQTRSDHILTVEDPIEYVFSGGSALVNQRQVGDHTKSFSRALRAALREDPDIIAITELRDYETISLAISAAETGHLVLGTLHTGNAAQTIHRMVSSFPADEQEQVRVMLAESLRAVVSQRLLPLATGSGRVPAVELLMVNTAVSNLIREDKTHQLPSVMQTGKAAGMLTLDDSLGELIAAGTITADAARRVAVKKERFG